MSNVVNLNQFAQTPMKGLPDLQLNANVKSVRLDPDSATATFKAGAPVYLKPKAGKQIIVDLCTGTQNVYGVLLASGRKNTFAKGDVVEIGCVGTAVWLEANAAFNRGQVVSYSDAANGIVADADNAYQVGVTLDQPAAAGELIRVEVAPPAP